MKNKYIIPKAEAIYCVPNYLAAGSGNNGTTPPGELPDGKKDSGTQPGTTPGENEAKRNLVGWSAGDGWDRIGM